MRMNILPQSLVVGLALQSVNRPDINPRLGTSLSINEDVFKFTSSMDVRQGAIVEKIDLSVLFADIPQSLVGIKFKDSALVDLSKVEAGVDTVKGFSSTTAEYPVDNNTPETVPATDALGVLFCQWKRLVGLTGLLRHEVSLSTVGETLFVEARNAAQFKGSVSISLQ